MSKGESTKRRVKVSGKETSLGLGVVDRDSRAMHRE